MDSSPPRLVTVGVLAAELGVRVDRVCWVLRTRPHIKPSAYAGNVRLFDNATIEQVQQALRDIEARRQRRREGGEP